MRTSGEIQRQRHRRLPAGAGGVRGRPERRVTFRSPGRRSGGRRVSLAAPGTGTVGRGVQGTVPGVGEGEPARVHRPVFASFGQLHDSWVSARRRRRARVHVGVFAGGRGAARPRGKVRSRRHGLGTTTHHGVRLRAFPFVSSFGFVEGQFGNVRQRSTRLHRFCSAPFGIFRHGHAVPSRLVSWRCTLGL